MKKLIIGAIVAAVILFIWQFLSWTVIKIHQNEMQYSENQDEIMECLAGKLDAGVYFLPNLPPDAGKEVREEWMKKSIGKPWAQIFYHNSMNDNMTMNMIRAFLTNFVAALLLCWVLLKIPDLSFKDTILSTLGIGLIGYLTMPYLNSIWFETNSLGHLIDVIVSLGLVGAWLGWWLRRP